MLSSQEINRNTICTLPNAIQIHILTYLRSYDLSPVQQTCRFYNDSRRINDVVAYFVYQVYGKEFADGALPFSIEEATINNNEKNDSLSLSFNNQFTIVHLRAIELAVVANVLALPEPPTAGFYVSKSWIKKTLLWLEAEQQKNLGGSSRKNLKKKLSKKQQRKKNRRLSDVAPPWPNVNSDIVCEHQNLQRLGAKAARSHRRLMDKKSWKILNKLYPDSTQLESKSGECLQCLMELQTLQKNESDKVKRTMMLRKQPLSNPHVRRFYTRTRGIPYHCLVNNNKNDDEKDQDGKAKNNVISSSNLSARCPLINGTYVVLPRSWCHQWRRYIKTGDGCKPLPPDSSSLLCDAHKLALLPPHLEAFLSGKTTQLFVSVKHDDALSATAGVPRSPPVGLAQPGRSLDNTRNALIAAGLSHTELAAQRIAMLQLEEQQQHPTSSATNHRRTSSVRNESGCNNKLLDCENHVVVELVTHEEWLALQQETGCWIGGTQHLVTVENDGHFSLSTSRCFECNPTGLRFSAPPCMAASSTKKSPKFRSKRWEPKIVEQKRVPNVEY